MKNTLLWILQVVLGLTFIGASYAHSFAVSELQLQPPMAWLAAVPLPLMLFIALCEFLGGLGLILPGLTKIQPRLTPIAAALLAVIMVLACGFHLTRGEYPNIGINLVLAALAAVIAYGRRDWLTQSPARTFARA
jgi:uncharacterized membrane protein